MAPTKIAPRGASFSPSLLVWLQRISTSVGLWLFLAACAHGLFYVWLLPPWQHYDEPVHFEYARLIVSADGVPAESWVDPELRREIADSMYRWNPNNMFFPAGVRPDLFSPDGPTLGADVRVHPATYYLVVALPLRLVQYLDIETQLIVARFVSVLLYALTILAAWRMMLVLAPDDPWVSISLPLLVLLTPTFADIMSAVNNDVLVNFAATVMFLGCALLLRDGIKPVGLLLTLLGFVVALLTKRTAVSLVPVILVVGVWLVARRPWPWWWWLIGGVSGGVALVFGLFDVTVAGVLQPRAWLQQLDDLYLRAEITTWLASVVDVQRTGQYYWPTVQVGFNSFWVSFSWDQINLNRVWEWLILAVVVGACVGLINHTWRQPPAELWARRVTRLMIFSIVVAGAFLVLRLHPVPFSLPYPYLPRGRYAFSIMVPLLWLISVGWRSLMPPTRQRWTLVGLIGLWSMLNLSAIWTIYRFYYS